MRESHRSVHRLAWSVIVPLSLVLVIALWASSVRRLPSQDLPGTQVAPEDPAAEGRP